MNLSATTILKSNIAFIVTLLLLVLIASPAQAKMYKWVDKEGITHYTQQPPVQEDSTVMDEPPTPPASAKESSPAGTSKAARQRKQSTLDAKKKQQCAFVRKNLEMLEKSMNIVRKRVKGKLVAMTEDERRQLTSQYKATISQHCE